MSNGKNFKFRNFVAKFYYDKEEKLEEDKEEKLEEDKEEKPVYSLKPLKKLIIPVDAFLSETHRYPTKVTKKPVESGEDISVYARPMPPELEVEGIVTDTPSSIWNVTTGAVEEKPGRATEKVQRLLELWEKAIPFSVTTNALGYYDNYIFSPLVIHQTPEDGNSIRFSATLVRIQVVDEGRKRPTNPEYEPMVVSGPVKAELVNHLPGLENVFFY